MSNKSAEVKKDESGKTWVRWQGKRKFVLVQDPEIFMYVVYSMIKNGEEATEGEPSK